MNGIFKRIWFFIITLELFNRRYYIYRDIINDVYYVRTRKLFSFPTFIFITHYDTVYKTIRRRYAIKNYKHSTKDKALNSITKFRKLHPPPKQLQYESINIF